MNKNKQIILGLLTICSLFITATAQNIYNVKEYGAKGDGVSNDRKAIQATIDMCSKSGGGIVTFPTGAFLTGTILIKSNVTLQIPAGTTILGIKNPDEYDFINPFQDGVGSKRGKCLIGAFNAENICIEGQGCINGQGGFFRTDSIAKILTDTVDSKKRISQMVRERPMLLRIVKCQNVKISNVKLMNPAAWTSNYQGCTDLQISDVTIRSQANGNNDGIDIDACQRVRISGCNIVSDDDGICLKNTLNTPCRDIIISNCIISSGHGAFKIGTESYGNFNNIILSDCIFYNSRGGIKIISTDGANIHNLLFSNVVMDNIEMPIFIKKGNRLNTYYKEQVKKNAGEISGVKFQNFTIRGYLTLPHPEIMLENQTSIVISGIPDSYIENISFNNIDIILAGGGKSQDCNIENPENASGYPEYNRYGNKYPAYGLFIRHAKNITVRDITIKTKSPDLRHVVYCKDDTDINIQNITYTSLPDMSQYFKVVDSKNINIEDSKSKIK